jgi:hypothetical protein
MSSMAGEENGGAAVSYRQPKIIGSLAAKANIICNRVKVKIEENNHRENIESGVAAINVNGNEERRRKLSMKNGG